MFEHQGTDSGVAAGQVLPEEQSAAEETQGRCFGNVCKSKHGRSSLPPEDQSQAAQQLPRTPQSLGEVVQLLHR